MTYTKEKIKELISPILIAKVENVEKHSNADRLQIIQINIGENEFDFANEDGTIQIVTAATNFKQGDLVPFLSPGNIVPGWKLTENVEIKLESRKMRGEISHGMILAKDEIGIGEDHSGIYVIEGDDSLVGKSINEILSESQIEHALDTANLLSGISSVTTEIIGYGDLHKLVRSEKEVHHYIGFEISGLVHLGQAIMTGLVVRELQELGINCRFFLADWHTWINNKLDSDWDLIKKVADEYLTPALKTGVKVAGGDPDKIEFIFGSNLYHNKDEYWQTVMEVSKNLTLSRVLKSTTILGREASNSMEFAMLIYPSMQAADIFEMQNHIAHAGTDQRNVHVIAREVAEKIKINPLKNPIDNSNMKPISIHHELVSGLQKPAQWPLPENVDKKSLMTTLKMSKSVAGSAIFINDSEKEIREKINKAFCPEKEIGYNPVLNWVKTMIFPIVGKFELKRDEKFGGNLTFNSFEDLESSFEKGEVFPLDLKNNVADILVDLLKPAQEIFADKAKIIEKIKEVKKRR